MAHSTSARIMAAARDRLLADGFANFSTRRVADAAGVPLSQIHYHFGGKQGLVLALLADEDQRLLDRQHQMYAANEPLWKRYEQACDFLDEDLRSGYVRVLQEMIAVGWSDREVAQQVVALLGRWLRLLEDVAREAEQRFGPLGPFPADDVGALVGLAFLGGEAVILLGDPTWSDRVRNSLRRFGELIRIAETGSSTTDNERRRPRRTRSAP